MATRSAFIPIVPNGDGPSVAIGDLVGQKTVVLSGFFSGSFTLFASHDGTNFAPVLLFNSDGQEQISQTLSEAYAAVRLRTNANTTGAVTASISGVSVIGQNTFLSFPPVSANATGPQPAIDTFALLPPSGFEVDVNIIASAALLTGTIIVEGGNDNVNFNPIGSFSGGQVQRSLVGLPALLEFAPLLAGDGTMALRYYRINVQGNLVSAATFTIGGGVPVSGGGGSGIPIPISIGPTVGNPTHNQVALGTLTTPLVGAIGIGSVAAGNNATANGALDIVVGDSSVSGPQGDCTLVGRSNMGGNSLAVAIVGRGITNSDNSSSGFLAGDLVTCGAGSDNVVAIGRQTAVGNNCGNSIAIGTTATINNTCENGIAVGNNAQIKSGSVSPSLDAIAIGVNAVVGNGVVASTNGTAIGNTATVVGDGSTAVGFNTAVTGANAVALGSSCQTTGNSSIVIGVGSTASGTSSITMGAATHSNGQYDIVIGSNCTTDVQGNNTLVGYTLTGGTNSVSIVIIGNTITNANVVNSNVLIGDYITNHGSGQVVIIGSQITMATGCTNSIALGLSPSVGLNSNNAIAIGVTASVGNGVTGATNSIAIGAGMDVVPATCVGVGTGGTIAGTSTSSQIIGDGNLIDDLCAKSAVIGTSNHLYPSSDHNVLMGANIVAKGSSCILIGNGARNTNTINANANSIAIGTSAFPTSIETTCIGHSTITGSGSDYSTLVGNLLNLAINSPQSVLVGYDINVETASTNVVAIGSGISVGFSVSSPNSIAIGSGATIGPLVGCPDSIAIGHRATCSLGNSIAIGASSKANQANEAVIGAGTLGTPLTWFHVPSALGVGNDLISFNTADAAANSQSSMRLYYKNSVGTLVTDLVTVDAATGFLHVTP